MIDHEFFKRCISGFIYFFSLASALLYFSFPISSLLFIVLFCILLFFELPRLFLVNTYFFWLAALLYLFVPLLMLLSLNYFYQTQLFIIFVAVCVFDSTAYLCGKLCGKHPLAKKISPNKTWEGFIGGYLGISLILLLFAHTHLNLIPTVPNILFAPVITITATLGDLFESWLKRRAHIKDSGTFLPGHGGILDRIDGFLFTVVFFFLYNCMTILKLVSI